LILTRLCDLEKSSTNGFARTATFIMKLTIAFGLSLFALPSVLAAGESCYYWDGAKYGVSIIPTGTHDDRRP
jgi:hypothetical protein